MPIMVNMDFSGTRRFLHLGDIRFRQVQRLLWHQRQGAFRRIQREGRASHRRIESNQPVQQAADIPTAPLLFIRDFSQNGFGAIGVQLGHFQRVTIGADQEFKPG